jgi:hypothetical protein
MEVTIFPSSSVSTLNDSFPGVIALSYTIRLTISESATASEVIPSAVITVAPFSFFTMTDGSSYAL